ncbi:MAG: hypothetical protein GX224_06880 [Thermoplasmatales archaeon]|nr:hypothetical protein [Thermoplasmatales archaeon]
MSLCRALQDIKVWVFSAAVLAIILGPTPFSPAEPMIAVLMVLMAVSMEGMELSRETLSGRGREMAMAVVMTFVIGTGATLLAGLPFYWNHKEIWYGWALLAAVPCAISTVTVAMYYKGDVESSLVSVTAVYFAALLATPLLTHIFLGEAVNPLEIVKYIVLFIAVPLVLSRGVKRMRPKREHKVLVVNATMFAIVFLAFSANRDALFTDWDVVAAIALLCIVRVFGMSFLMTNTLYRMGDEKGKAIVRVSMAVWRNSGLAATMALVLFPGMPGVALPAVISLAVENAWFALSAGNLGRLWERDGPAPA